IRREDAGCEKQFVENRSAESRYFRFMQSLDKLSPLMLARFTQIDYDREMALIAIINENTPQARILGVVRYVSNSDRHSCEFALTVADEWQRKGIGRHLMQRLMFVARDRGIEVMEGEVLANNSKMLRLCQDLGFRIVHNGEEPDVVGVRRHL
ncbi:MAG: GNAT family N-acetyltransferase, partial [Gammaproteobacteria bacterium]|nr:GNAT family N-acetyltransferase [Gammaproteobacteria bacterium]